MKNNRQTPLNKIYSHNVNGLRTKITDFLADVLTSDYGIYMLCETHLNDAIYSSEIFPANFNVYRCLNSREPNGTLSAIISTGIP